MKSDVGRLPIGRRLPACPPKNWRKRREGGFALLLVFLMAAIIGIMLFMELPRVAFDSQRQKEQLLIERGEQYQIAIRRYMQRGIKNGMSQGPPPTWPTKIEDLENTNGRRFLRKRYIDPMTGKDEWRLIHINNGVLTDSVNTKNNQQTNQQWGNGPQGITEFAGLGQTPASSSAQGLNAVNRRRASDSNPVGGDTSGTAPADATGVPPNQTAGAPVQGPQPGLPGFLPGGTAVNGPVSPLPGGVQPGSSGQPPAGASNNPGGFSGSGGMSGASSSFGGSTPTNPATPSRGLPEGFPGAPANSAYGGSPYPVLGQPGQAGVPPAAPPQSVSQLLNNMLTQPRPGGMPVANSGGFGTSFTTPPGVTAGSPIGAPVAVPTSGMGTTMGGGLAGVASTLDADSIMVCGDHTNYHEWEFIFDPSKWKAPANPNTQLGGKPAGSSSNNTAGSLNTGSNSGPGQVSTGGSAGAGPGPVTAPSGGPNLVGGPPPPGNPPGAPGQGMAGMNNQGNFGNVCGMEARPGAR